jgi:hypothetical protein
MPEVPVFRLNLLRATYLLLLVGLAFDQWPGLLHHPDTWTVMRGVVCAMLTAVSLVAVLGLRYPLQMLPLLLFELTWKTIWLLAFALPPWLGHRMTAGVSETAFACVLGLVIFPAVIPWPYVVAHYLKKPGDRWR